MLDSHQLLHWLLLIEEEYELKAHFTLKRFHGTNLKDMFSKSTRCSSYGMAFTSMKSLLRHFIIGPVKTYGNVSWLNCGCPHHGQCTAHVFIYTSVDRQSCIFFAFLFRVVLYFLGDCFLIGFVMTTTNYHIFNNVFSVGSPIDANATVAVLKSIFSRVYQSLDFRYPRSRVLKPFQQRLVLCTSDRWRVKLKLKIVLKNFYLKTIVIIINI